MIGIARLRAEKAGAIRRPLPIKVADRYQIHRREGECGVDVAEGVAAGANETDAQLPGVFVVVSNARDKRDVSELFADCLAIRGGEDNEEQRFRRSDVGGTMPDIGLHGDCIPRFHFGFRAIGHRVADVTLDHDEDFTAVGMIMPGIAASGFKPAAAYRDFATVSD